MNYMIWSVKNNIQTQLMYNLYIIIHILYFVFYVLYFIYYILYFLFFFNFSYQWYLNGSSFCHAPLLMNIFRSCSLFNLKFIVISSGPTTPLSWLLSASGTGWSSNGTVTATGQCLWASKMLHRRRTVRLVYSLIQCKVLLV